MLAGMSNLAALVHAGDAKAPQFNSIFYATVATIIPVLFVAAALQADVYAKLIDTSRAAQRRYLATNVLREQLRTSMLYFVTAFVPGIILAYGVIGEIQALLNLYLQRTIGVVGPVLNGTYGPLVSAVALTVAVAIGPAAKFVTVFKGEPSQPGKSAENPSGDEPHEHGTATGEPPPPEHGKSGDGQNLQRGRLEVAGEPDHRLGAAAERLVTHR